jgi:hypothetical protein
MGKVNQDAMQKQSDEFDAMEVLAKAWRNITLTPIVDDDYPSVRRVYESALCDFLAACRANGRLAGELPPRVGDGSGDAALAIGEHAFIAGYEAAINIVQAGASAVVNQRRMHQAWLDYDPPEDIKALS